MLGRRMALGLVLLGLLVADLPCFGGLSPYNIAVVVNELSTESEAVGRYYCGKATIPFSNLIEVQTDSVNEEVTPAYYAALAEQIRDKLVSQLGVDPDDPENDPIQVLVMCYGVPSRVYMGENVDPKR